MRVVTWLFNLVLFVLALGFALSNTDSIDLRFMPGGLQWRAPLVVFLLIFLAAGVVLGLLAAGPSLFRQRREIARLNKELRHATRPANGGVTAATPPVDAVPDPVTRLGV
ncbi:MAG: LapA family protein [Burkholderiales bacterium]|nr:LapA family protein [Burkholderiales bacterium]